MGIRGESDPVDCQDGDWGFWDETWTERRSGYDTEAEARQALKDYTKTL